MGCFAVNDRYVHCAREELDPVRQDEMDGTARFAERPTTHLASIRAAQLPAWHTGNMSGGTGMMQETRVIYHADTGG